MFRQWLGIGFVMGLVSAGILMLTSPTQLQPETVIRQENLLQTAGPAGYKRFTENTELNLDTVINAPISPVTIHLSDIPTNRYNPNNEYDRWVRGEIDLGESHSRLTQIEVAALQAEANQLSSSSYIFQLPGEPSPSSPIVDVSFESLDIDDCCGGGQLTPPDPDLAVGRDHVISVVNAAFMIHDKDGNLLIGPVTLDAFFASLGGGCASFPFDPNAVYDEEAGRYVIAADGDGAYYCVGVSQTDSATGSWHLYAFPTNVGGQFFDYPHLGVGRDALYMGANMFGAGTGRVWAFEKWEMYAGMPAGSVTIATGSDFTPQPLKLHGYDQGSWPTSGPHYFMAGRSGASTVALYAWDDPFGTNSLTVAGVFNLQTEHGVPVGYPVTTLQQGGGGMQANDNRPLDFEYRNGSGWTTMVVSCNPGSGTVNCIQWAEVDLTNQTVVQAGVFASNAQYRTFPDLAVNHCGDMAVGYTKSSTSMFPSVWATGREYDDPLGSVQPEVEIKAGEISYTGYDGSPYRWGDYTGMSVDPDGVTFWYLGEYSKENVTNTSANWGTYIGSLSFANCSLAPDFNLEPEPEAQTACVPDDALYTITVSSLGGYTDAVNLSASGVPTGYWASFNPSTVVPEGSSQLTLNGTMAGSAGSYNIEITGVAPTSTHTTTVQLTLYDDTPTTPSLISPANGAADVALLPTLEWSAIGDATQYTLLVATNPTFSNIVYTATTSLTSHIIASSLNPLSTYYWTVRAVNPCGGSTFASPYSFTTRDIPPILLVDDDDNSPNVQATYTAALTSLGLSYDLWDTNNSDNEPDVATLGQYEIVIWFTGDEFGGASGPGSAGEAALGSYLSSGNNCLFLSGQDYIYDRGVTAFMQTYLGLGSAQNDVSQTTVTGQGVYAGMGPYTLTYPFTNYSDRVTPDATAASAFTGNAGNAAINKEAGYRTVFFAYPFEALPVANRNAVLQTTLDWCGGGGPELVAQINYAYFLNNGTSDSGSFSFYDDGTFVDDQTNGGVWQYQTGTGIQFVYTDSSNCSAFFLGQFQGDGTVRGLLACTDGSGARGVWGGTLLTPMQFE